eukprot:753607-Hanusia_phi.AAC.2
MANDSRKLRRMALAMATMMTMNLALVVDCQTEEGDNLRKNSKQQDAKEQQYFPSHEGPQDAMHIYNSIVQPTSPKKIRLPLSDEDELKFVCAREALQELLKQEAEGLDIRDKGTKDSVLAKAGRHEGAVHNHLLQAVKDGMTLQEARIGMIIAQFESLDAELQRKALEQGRVRVERLPEDAKKRMRHNLMVHNDIERVELEATEDKESWFRRKIQAGATPVVA